MAPRTINDEDILLEIALIEKSSPDFKFSTAYRKVRQDIAFLEVFSEDSARRRVQRKYNKGRDYYLSLAEEELRAQREIRLQKAIERGRLAINQHYASVRKNAQYHASAVAALRKIMDGARPAVEQIQKMIQDTGPALEQFQEIMSSQSSSLEEFNKIFHSQKF